MQAKKKANEKPKSSIPRKFGKKWQVVRNVTTNTHALNIREPFKLLTVKKSQLLEREGE